MKFKINVKNVNYAILAFISVISICSITLFLRPIIGMGDNGDFFRVISQSNIYYLQHDKNYEYFGYFNKDYGIYKYNNDNEKMIVSTQIPLIKIAVFLDKLITKSYTFDIRILAFLYVIIYAFSAYFLVKVLTEDINLNKFKLLITILFIFIFCDTGYIAYFNSFFGEAVDLSFFLFSLGILLYMYKFEKYTILNLILFFTSSLIFIGSKQQIAPVGILVALVLFRLFICCKKRVFRYTALCLAAVIIVSSLYFYRSLSSEFNYINSYDTITRGVLLYENNPDDILKQLGINPQYSILQNTTPYSSTTPVINFDDEKLKKELYSKYSFLSILGFYLIHPKVFLKMINYGFVNGYSIRPKVIGNYEKREGKPFGQQSHFFSLWSSIKEKLFPHNFFLTVVAFAIYFRFAVERYLIFRREKNINAQLSEEVLLYVFLVGISQIFISIIGEGDVDLAKHEFMFNVTFDIMLLYSACMIIKSIYNKSDIDDKN